MFYSALPEIDRLFPGAPEYRQWMFPHQVGEQMDRYFPYSERHLQALWFDDSLRPSELKTSRGEAVTVECAGRWNLEAGPDFHGAVLLIGRERRRVSGDAEIHIVSTDWKAHGHCADPRYAGVRFHITWFGGPVDESLFPPGTVHLFLSESVVPDLERIDLTAYPYAEPRASSFFPLGGKPAESVVQLLENAGQERLRQKTQRMAWLIHERGAAQALYEETSVALGYKNNKEPFRKLAQALPLSALAQYGSDWEPIYAVLLGVAGLLPKQPGPKWSSEAKAYLRSLWDCWWHEQHKWEEVELLRQTDWNFSGMRPLNHPVRRLCALAQWATMLQHGAARPDSELLFQCLKKSFWSTHLGWSGMEKPAELVGKDRAQAMELNVFIPYRWARGEQVSFENLRIEPMNSIIRETAYTLLGPDHSPRLYRTALARQGMIQLFNDFILTGRAVVEKE